MAKLPTHITREDLYTEIWSTPAETLAERYGISGRGLGKICDRLQIPVPPRGWWAKKHAGHKVSRIPLPSPRANTPQQVEIRATEPPEVMATLPPPVERELAAIADDPIPVPETLQRAHPLIAVWLEEDRERAQQYRDRGWGAYMPRYGTSVQKRVLRILSALFQAIEGKDGTVDVKSPAPNAVDITLNGQKIALGLTERRQQVRAPLTLKERRESWNSSRTYRQSLEPTGELVFRIKTYPGTSGVRLEWKERDGVPLEEQLPAILVGLMVVAGHREQWEVRRKEEERARWVEQRRCYEAREKAEREAAKIERLFAQATAWREAREAEALLTAVEQRLNEVTDATELAEMRTWIVWAREKIAERDPLGGEVTEVLREPDDE